MPRPRIAQHLLLILMLGCSAVLADAPATRPAVVAPPADEARRLSLHASYAKYVSADGFPVVASAKVNDYALQEAAYLVRHMLGHRPDCRDAMIRNQVRLSVMAYNEFTTDVPEHADLKPADRWNRRARGLGPTRARPAVSCGEENLLNYPGDPYAAENILIHEFAHAIHLMGMTTVDPTFDDRLKSAYESARKKGLWKDTYAMTNHAEYWGEGTQSWFNTNRRNDRDHGDIDTREKLKAYDPDLAKLLAEVYGDTPWRYARPLTRPPEDRPHLAGYDASKAPRFVWPKTFATSQPAATQPAASAGR
jgi:hypothetical protein